jgi:hypothetical protein
VFIQPSPCVRIGYWAELVALDVIHDVVAFAALFDEADPRGPETDGALDRSIDSDAPLLVGCAPGSADVDVEMDSVLELLRLGNALEEDPRPAALGVADSAGRVPFALGDTVLAEASQES